MSWTKAERSRYYKRWWAENGARVRESKFWKHRKKKPRPRREPRLKTCSVCQAPFSSPLPRLQVCSDACREARARAPKKKARVVRWLPCVVCGSMFPANGRRQVCGETCRKERMRLYVQARRHPELSGLGPIVEKEDPQPTPRVYPKRPPRYLEAFT